MRTIASSMSEHKRLVRIAKGENSDKLDEGARNFMLDGLVGWDKVSKLWYITDRGLLAIEEGRKAGYNY